jgi:molybdate transport system ATP-binding protein
MNRFPGTVRSLQVSDGVSLMTFDALGERLVMLGLEPPAGLEEGGRVLLGVKGTQLLLSRKAPEGLSLLNALPAEVERIERGELLAAVELRSGMERLEALLPREALEPLALEPGDGCWVCFQASALSILELRP